MKNRFLYVIWIFVSLVSKAYFIQRTQPLNIGIKNGDEPRSRKLEESQNYITLTFNQECSFEITGDDREEDYTFNKSDISYIFSRKKI